MEKAPLKSISFGFCLTITLMLAASAHAADLTLKYSQPATRWTEALPVGNGRFGAMIFGDVTNEQLQLNEATLWSGGPRDWNNPGAKEILPQVRAAIFAGDYVKAGELCKKMQGSYNESYQPLDWLHTTAPRECRFGDEKISYHWKESSGANPLRI